MMISDKPEDLERRAEQLEQEAERFERGHLPLTAKSRREQADRMRRRAAELRKLRTDGVRFA